MRHSPFNEQFGFDLKLHLWLLLLFVLPSNAIYIDHVSNIGGTVITQFRSVQVENLLVFVVLAEVIPHRLDEHFTNICFHIMAIWWIESYNLCFYFFESFEYCYY